jgi:hypothetical protein
VTSTGQQGNFWFGQPLATEQQVGVTAEHATFYYYNGTTSLFTSTDSGASFTETYSAFPPWNCPFFGIATPPRGAAPGGDIWAFAGWKLHHSINGGKNFSSVWSFYHPSHTLAIGALPPTRSSVTGRNEMELAGLCGAKAALAARKEALPLPTVKAGYVVYVLGVREYSHPEALFASVDFGHSWIQLSGGNITARPENGLGDSPVVIEPSRKDLGTVLVGTGGRGVFYRNVTKELQAALLSCED